MATISKLISGKNQTGKDILSLITKRTYIIKDDGEVVLSDEQQNLQEDIEFNKDFSELLIYDTDLYPEKPFTDIVIKGSLRNPSVSNSFNASISVGNCMVEFKITGNRSVQKNQSGNLIFSDGEIIEEIALCYTNSYGGKDLIAEKPLREKVESYIDANLAKEVFDPYAGSPYRYPRNPVGKGYIVEATEESLEILQLPNIEYPDQLVDPSNLLCKNPMEWYNMPLSAGTGWISPGWFPRVAYFGFYPLPKGLDENIAEIKKKWGSETILNSVQDITKSKLDFRACNGASLGLQMQRLAIGQECRLKNIHPRNVNFIFKIPKEIPIIKVDGRNGKMINTDPKMHTIVIEPDKNLLSIIWCGSAKALRPYMEEELINMPFEVKW